MTFDLMGPAKINIPEGIDLTGKSYRAVKTEADRQSLLQAITEATVVAFDIETWSDNLWRPDQMALDPHTGFIAGLSFCVQPYYAFYLPLTHTQEEFNAPDDYVVELLKVLVTKKVIMHNASFDSKWVYHHYGLEFGEIEDTMVMAYLINPNHTQSKSLKNLSEDMLGERMIPYDDSFPFYQYEVDGAALYAGGDADVTFRLAEKMRPKMSVFKFLFKVECELTKVVGRVELNGVPADPTYFKEASEKVSTEIAKVAEELWTELKAAEMFGPFTVNYGKILNSPAKLAILLYDGLGLPITERSAKTQKPSVNANALNQLKGSYPVVVKLLLYKELVKLRSSFLENLPEWISPYSGRVHCNFLQCHVPTGRFASSSPNMQQIPTHDVVSVRKAFKAPEDWRFVAFDYSQVEMRIFASEVDDPVLKNAFAKGIDLHKQTASIMLGIPVDQVSEMQRQVGKVLNFGLVYGMGAYGLAFRIGVTEEAAQQLIDAYFRGMPRSRMWIDDTVKNARRQGGIFTHFGRWRGLPEINSKNPRERSKGERGAVNSKIQGAAADVMKIAMVRADKAIRKFGDKVQMVLTIHDDLTFLVHKSVSDQEFVDTIKPAMEFPIEKFVPLKVDIKVGPTWGDLQKFCQTCYQPYSGEHACVTSEEYDDEPITEEDLEQAEPLVETVIINPPGGPVTPNGSTEQKIYFTKTVVNLVAKEGLTEQDLAEMLGLFGPNQEYSIELTVNGVRLSLPPNLTISNENLERWEKLYGVPPNKKSWFAETTFA